MLSLLQPFISRSVCAVFVLPEGCEHHYGCHERDKRGGITHSVDLSERREVTCLDREKEGQSKVRINCNLEMSEAVLTNMTKGALLLLEILYMVNLFFKKNKTKFIVPDNPHKSYAALICF